MATKYNYTEQTQIELIPGLSRSMTVNIYTKHIVFKFSFLGEQYNVPGYEDSKGFFKAHTNSDQAIVDKYIERHRHEVHISASSTMVKHDYVKTIAKLADFLANSTDQVKIDKLVRVIEEV